MKNGIAIRTGIATGLTFLLVASIFEVTWQLPMNSIDQWLTAFHTSAFAVFVALFWSLTGDRMLLLIGSLLTLGIGLPSVWVLFGVG